MAATRRELMAASALALFPGTALAGDGLTVLGRRLSGLLASPESAYHVASAYLQGLDGIGWRRAALALDMPSVLAPVSSLVSTDSLRAWLGARIRADFDEGAVIDVDGWRLSRTEVGACVLAVGAGEVGRTASRLHRAPSG